MRKFANTQGFAGKILDADELVYQIDGLAGYRIDVIMTGWDDDGCEDQGMALIVADSDAEARAEFEALLRSEDYAGWACVMTLQFASFREDAFRVNDAKERGMLWRSPGSGLTVEDLAAEFGLQPHEVRASLSLSDDDDIDYFWMEFEAREVLTLMRAQAEAGAL